MPSDPDLPTRLADMLLIAKTTAAAAELPFRRSDVIRVLREGLAKEKAPVKTIPKRKPMNQMSEEEFILYLENEPALSGVDVKREIGRCQFWCSANGAQPTRLRIFKWLMKAERDVKFSGAGKSSKPPVISPKAFFTIETPVPGWPFILRHKIESIPEPERNELCKLDWLELSEEVRRLIIKHA